MTREKNLWSGHAKSLRWHTKICSIAIFAFPVGLKDTRHHVVKRELRCSAHSTSSQYAVAKLNNDISRRDRAECDISTAVAMGWLDAELPGLIKIA